MNVHEQVIQNMKEMAEKFGFSGAPLEMPPQSNFTLGTRYTEIDFGKMLTAEVKYDSRFANPTGAFQGGFLCAVFDEAYGPLSYMAAKRPVVTIEMSTTFVRPFSAKDEIIAVRAEVVARTKSLMVMKAEAKTKAGKLVATSSTHSLIVTDQTLNLKVPPKD